ncbi:WavQ [Vogesella oryzae]|uniref:WavQ n=1 Tax=Vogesella oryzae TaxID=1735285 RepID=UPI0015837D8A|nr:WavQ [Vogesella oryzae]
MVIKFLVVSPPFQETSGGVVVLHKLCDILNELGYSSYIYPHINARPYYHGQRLKTIFLGIYDDIKLFSYIFFHKFQLNPKYNTPLLKSCHSVRDSREWIVIYPEIVDGNPVAAKNVVRWFLHRPGFHTNQVFYGTGELYYRFNDAIRSIQIEGSTMADDLLRVISFPIEHYNMDGVSTERKGTAYCLRKGKGKKIVHDLNDSILIDGMSHSEVAAVLKKVKQFISYDTYTAYSIFAILCGSESIVIPDDGISEEQWYPSEEDRYGIAYGFDRLDWAASTRELQISRVITEHERTIASVDKFAKSAIDFFASSLPSKSN